MPSSRRNAAAARYALIVVACAALGACDGWGNSGGGSSGGGSSGGGSSSGQPPQFASSAEDFSTVENTPPAQVVATVTATDPEGATVSYSLAGADAAAFTIGANGDVRFSVPPDYDLPADLEQDNIYNIDVVASDGSQSTTKAIRIAVTNDREGLSVTRWTEGRTDWMADHPVAAFHFFNFGNGVTAMLAAERTGVLRMLLSVDDTGFSRTISAVDPARGIIAMTPDPNFASNGLFYVMFNSKADNIEVRRFPREFVYDTGTPEPTGSILSVPHQAYDNNIGGWLGFGPDGLLYVALPDAGGVGDVSGSSQDDNSRLGKVLRFNADFSTVTTIAKGLRNPSGGSFLGAVLVLGDQGEAQREEIDLIPLDGASVLNLGWPYKEGTATVRAGGPGGLVDPIIEYPHGPGARAGYRVVAGDVYFGPSNQLQGKYLFAERDFQGRGGFIFAVPANRLVPGQPTIQAREFENRTLDIFGAYAYVLNPAWFFRYSGRSYIVDETTQSQRGSIYRIN
jgi:hypothetical protein